MEIIPKKPNPLTVTLFYLVGNLRYKKDQYPLSRRTYFYHSAILKDDNLISKNDRMAFNIRLITHIAKTANVSLPTNLPAIPGTEVTVPINSEEAENARLWYSESRPLKNYTLTTEKEKMAYQIFQIYRKLYNERTGIWYHIYENNPPRSPKWTNYMKTAEICLENDFNPDDFVAAQFAMLTEGICVYLSRSRGPQPNLLHSKNAIQRYYQYFIQRS